MTNRPVSAALLSALFLLAIASAGAQTPALFARSPQYPLLPRDLEIELARSAAPAHLRQGAAIWLLEPGGYVKAIPGTNAFACIVSRRGGDVFPVCWDAEGTQSVMQVDLDDAKLRLAGKTGAEIDALVTEGFKTGRYRAPSRAGISYMLSPLRYRIDEAGKVTRTAPIPHLMFYGPNLTDQDIGGVRGAQVFMNKVGPDGMIIVPVGQKEREQILVDSKSLTDRFEQVLGYHPDK